MPAGSTIKLGRAASCDIPIDDNTLSRIHAVIEVSASGALTIVDLGSSSGVELNGSRVHNAPLNVGDVLRLGEVTIEVGGVAEMPAAPDPAAASAPTPLPRPSAPPPAQVAPASAARAVFAAALVGMLAIGLAIVMLLS